MKRYYACLAGNWIDITDDGTVENQNPYIFFEEQLTYKEGSFVAECFKYDYINIQYQGKNYRINPVFIQIVTD